ncbi:tetraspanin-32 isoform 2-T2 [Hipposideros larvatus]
MSPPLSSGAPRSAVRGAWGLWNPASLPPCQPGGPAFLPPALSSYRPHPCPGFLCFALVFCILGQVAFWRFHNPAQVEDTVLDTYDLVYEQAVKNPSGPRRQELLAIQDTFLCCGKRAPSSLLGSSEADLCTGEEATRQDCLQGIRSFLRTHGGITSALTGVGLVSMGYAMLLSSFLWFAIRSGRSLSRKGTYTLSPRARGCQPQEPRFFRRSQEGLALHHLSEAGALRDHLGPSRCSSGPRLLQDN